MVAGGDGDAGLGDRVLGVGEELRPPLKPRLHPRRWLQPGYLLASFPSRLFAIGEGDLGVAAYETALEELLGRQARRGHLAEHVRDVLLGLRLEAFRARLRGAARSRT